jgi:hypothetical protein
MVQSEHVNQERIDITMVLSERANQERTDITSSDYTIVMSILS